MSSSNALERLNHTELYQACRRIGIQVSPKASRAELIQYLAGDADPPPLDETTHPIDSWRHGIIRFLLDHWSMLEPQIKCPAKNLKHHSNPNPRPCFGCTDAQVIHCVVQNPSNEHLIQVHRPQRRQ